MFGITAIPWAKIAALFAAVGLGAYLTLTVYAGPKIAAQDKTIADMKAASEKDRADFETAARAKDKEYQDERDHAAAAYEELRAAKDADLTRVLAAGSVLQHTVDAYVGAHQRSGLPGKAGPSCGPDGAAATLGDLFIRALDLSAKRTADAERLADQLRALQDYEIRK